MSEILQKRQNKMDFNKARPRPESRVVLVNEKIDRRRKQSCAGSARHHDFSVTNHILT